MRAQGWAIVDQELEEGLRSVAAPIRDREREGGGGDQPLGARQPVLDRVDAPAHLLPPLLATAARIEADVRVGLIRREALGMSRRGRAAWRG